MGRGARIGEFVRRHRYLSVGVVLGAAAVAIFVIAFFEPQKLFIDERVNEQAPVAARPDRTRSPGGGATEQARPVPEPPAGPVEVVAGTFRGLEHSTTGTASVVELADGSRILRLDQFETSNGPDLRVYLSAGSNDAFFGREYGENFVELGELKGNIGSQNYPIPAGVDLATYRNAVIWCKRFAVGFGVATLE